MDVTYFNPWAEVQMKSNHLPHWEQSAATYFLTFRLADSLPAALRDQWSSQREDWLRHHPEPWSPAEERQYHQRFSMLMERWLDQGHGECLLRRAELRQAVEAVLMKFNTTRCHHHAWVLMPNHAHLVVSLAAGESLATLMKAWNGSSSRAVGLLLERSMSGKAFWQKDYFDRLIRDRAHFLRCLRYVKGNPTKARLQPSEFTLYLSPQVQALQS